MVYACRLLMIWAFIPFGMNAQTAKWAIAPQYSSITPYGEDMYKVKIGKQVGVVDKDGKIIVGVYADSITNMVEDCSLVLRFVDGKNKLVSILHKDKTTSQISEDWYVGNYTFFSEGKLPVCNKKGRFGYIGPNGRVILDFAYSVAHPFSEGWASVCKGKNLFSVGLNAVSGLLNAKNKDKVFYVNENGQNLVLQSDIGDIYTGTTFKNGEALVITKDNRYCVINTSGQLLKIDNNIVLSFDEYYAIGQHADKSAKGTKSRIVYDGPTVYSEDDLYGYKQGSAIVLPAQFDDAQPFSRGYAIASKDNKYGLLKLYPGYFQCRSSVGSLKSVDAGMESVDYVVTVPQAWQEAELELFCSNDRGEKVNLSQPGNAKSTRIFSLVLPKKETRNLLLEGENLQLWNSSMIKNVSNVAGNDTGIGIAIAPSKVKANADDVASVVVTLTNQTGEAVEFEAVITGNQLITKKEKVSLDAGQSKKIYATFTKIIKEEKRVVTVTVPDINKVSKSITVEPFFVNF